MPQSTQTFARCTSDLADEIRPASDFVRAVNIALEDGFVQPQRGNVLVSYTLPSTGVNKRLGGFQDGTTGTQISLLYNSAGNHRIIRYDPNGNNGAGSETTLLQWSGLNLTASTVIQGGILDGELIFLDGPGRLRGVPLARVGEYTPTLLAADPFALHLVKQAPQTTPMATRETNASTTDPRTAINRVSDFAWQFAFQYEYKDGDRTPLGPHSDELIARLVLDSQLQGLTPQSDPRNFIRIQYPASGVLPSPYVDKLRVLARRGGETVWQVAGEMTTGQPFDFYGVFTGEVLTDAEADKLFESVPVSVKAAVVVNSRVLVGDCVESYAPTWPLTSLTAAAGLLPGVTITVYQVDTFFQYYVPGEPSQDGSPVPDVAVDGRATRYFMLLTGTYPDPASTYTELTYTAGVYYVKPGPAVSYNTAFVTFTPPEYDNGPGARVVTIVDGVLADGGAASSALAGFTFHDRASYPVGIAFFDELNRTAGAEAVRPVSIPRQDYTLPRSQTIEWTLSGSTAVPPWARSYNLLVGLNNDVTFYQQYYVDEVNQYEGDDADGNPILNIIGHPTLTLKAYWVSLVRLLDTGRGYAFTEGDRLRFPAYNDRLYDVPILYQRGGYVAIPIRDYGTRTPGFSYGRQLVELYTPAPAVERLFLYERGPRMAILNPGTSSAALSVLTGTLAGDSMLGIVSPNYVQAGVPEAPAFDTNAFTGWLAADRGRPIAVVRDGQQVRRNALIRFSGVKVQGTKINGLGQWDALNQYEELPQEQGAIVRLTVADQTQSDGSILFVNQERGTDSLSLSRSQIQTADGNVLLGLTKQVIGGSNALRGGYGCTDPAAVIAYAGKVYFPCREREEVLAYDRNGLVPLGEVYKFRQRLKELFRLHLGDAITGCYDPRRREYWLTFHGQTPTTLVYSERREAWADAIGGIPEAGSAVGNELVTYLNGALWRHTPTAPSETFFGLKTRASITTVAANPNGLLTKRWQAIGINSDSPWEPTELTTRDGQKSRILAVWLKYTQGLYRAAIRRDENTPGAGDAAYKLHNGRVMQSTALSVTLSAPLTNATPLKAATFEYLVSTAQQPNQ